MKFRPWLDKDSNETLLLHSCIPEQAHQQSAAMLAACCWHAAQRVHGLHTAQSKTVHKNCQLESGPFAAPRQSGCCMGSG